MSLQAGDVIQVIPVDAAYPDETYNEFLRRKIPEIKAQGMEHKAAFHEAARLWRSQKPARYIMTVLGVYGPKIEVSLNQSTPSPYGNLPPKSAYVYTVQGNLLYDNNQPVYKDLQVLTKEKPAIPTELASRLPPIGSQFYFGYILNQRPLTFDGTILEFLPQENRWLIQTSEGIKKLGLLSGPTGFSPEGYTAFTHVYLR